MCSNAYESIASEISQVTIKDLADCQADGEQTKAKIDVPSEAVEKLEIGETREKKYSSDEVKTKKRSYRGRTKKIQKPFMGGTTGSLVVRDIKAVGKFYQVLVGEIDIKRMPKAFIVEEKGYKLRKKQFRDQEKSKLQNEPGHSLEKEEIKIYGSIEQYVEEGQKTLQCNMEKDENEGEFEEFVPKHSRYTIIVRGTANMADVITDIRFRKKRKMEFDNQVVSLFKLTMGLISCFELTSKRSFSY